MTYEHLVYEQRAPITIITINRPERMNAIGPQTHQELVDAWSRFRDDDDALVGVLTGAGDRAFCAGGDLKAAVDLGYRITLARHPSPVEMEQALVYLENNPARLKEFAWLLFNLDEFIYVR